MKITYLILLMTILLLGGCGQVNPLRCLSYGLDCPVSDEQLTRSQLEQDVRLDGIDEQIDAAMEILGRDRLDISEVIDLCDNGSEILIRLDGELVAFNTRRGGYLDFLTPGRYITTDGTGCQFNVDGNLQVTY